MPPNKSLAPSFTLKVLAPSLVAVSSIALLLLYIVNGIFEETNRLDTAASAKLVGLAMDSQRRSLETIIVDNAVWNDAAINAGASVNQKWTDENWGVTTGLGTYDSVFIVDQHGKTVYAARDGKRSDVSAEDYFGEDVVLLLAASRENNAGGGQASAMFRSGGNISNVSAALILPFSALPEAAGKVGNTLVFSRTIDDGVLTALAKSYALDGLRFTSGRSPGGDGVISLNSISGRSIANLTWKSRSPGTVVRDRYGFVVTMILVMFLFVISILLYMSWKGFKEAHEAQAEAVAASLRDDLTGLANRRQMLSALTRCLGAARADKSPLSVIYADLDGFKEVNDSYGHEIGDKLLKAAAAGFAYLGREAEAIARLGGDEFAMILTGPGSAEKARRIAQSMISFLEEPMVFDGRIASVSVSAGVVDLEADEADVEEIIRRADVAMYAAKSAGRARVHIYQASLDFKRDGNRAMALELREHIDKGRLTVVYQPIVDARTRRTKGVEALVRWPKDAATRYTPDIFIPVAEEFGLIEDLGRFVLNEACRQAAQWRDIFVAVNVSPIQFMNPNFAELVEITLKRTGLDAKRLEVEVTEGFIIDNAARANAIINRLHDMHVRVALDDFGTGFSSIGHLRRFKFDKLKLDRSMVSDILRQPSALRLVQGTIAMADALGLSVVAEGIEDESQVSVLRLAGCSLFQGYLFSKPIEAHELTAFLNETQTALAS